ncbi:MAG: ATP-dependent DNA ligase [Nocardioidaceae bacterium]|nr:ATP-dependent DNA ligase [Nocardioidaceae bacterium]
MLLHRIVAASMAVSATRSRLAKRAILAEVLAATEPDDIHIVVSYLAGELRQRRTGLGWSSLGELPPPAAEATLTVADVDAQFEHISRLSGAGSASTRERAVSELFARATADEQGFLRRLVFGELRQGALDSAMLDAISSASSVPLPLIRRAVMLRGATSPVAQAALTRGAAAVAAFTLQVGQPVRPMLASTAPDVTSALEKLGVTDEVVVDTKLDGIRIQVHKDRDEIRIFTRSLDDITGRLPEVVAVMRSLPAAELILDGEAMLLGPDEKPRPFQETSARTATRSAGLEAAGDSSRVTPFFFDCLYVDGQVLMDDPLEQRLRRLDGVTPDALRVPRLVTAEPSAAERFFAETVAAGQEGVILKALDAIYDAGRRGSGWIKVKPRHTLDLVVLAVEWGSGRRQGKLSNIHLGAHDPATGGFVMLGKTFKGMTDEMLHWQTQRFLELETARTGHVVQVRPEQVVEIAFDGLQRSTRYPGGLALRFARVLRYRDDKQASDADTIDQVRALAATRGAD